MKANKANINKKRILIVIPGLSYGGAERVTSYICNYLSSLNREVYILSFSDAPNAYPLSSEIYIKKLNTTDITNKINRYIYLISNIRKTIRLIRPNSILAMVSYAGSLTAIAALGLRIPIIISERNDPHTSTTFSPFEKRIFLFVHRYLVTKAIYQTESAKTYYFASDSSKAVVIPNPLYLEEMPAPNTSVGLSHKCISAGRLTKQKNHRLLIEAFSLVHAKHPEYTLEIYGEGENRVMLEQLIRDLNLTDVVYLPGNEKCIFKRLQEAEMFVMSSDYEGIPNALIEAMAMGLPCITTDYSDGRGTVIENGVNGLLIPRYDSAALANAMITLIENRLLAIKIAHNAKLIRGVLDSHTICVMWSKAIEKTENDYYKTNEI